MFGREFQGFSSLETEKIITLSCTNKQTLTIKRDKFEQESYCIRTDEFPGATEPLMIKLCFSKSI